MARARSLPRRSRRPRRQRVRSPQHLDGRPCCQATRAPPHDDVGGLVPEGKAEEEEEAKR